MIGYTDVCKVDFSFAMQLTRVHEDPRVTRPYTDAQWAAIQEIGRQVDRDLAKQDVRLTQGGEPTFVSSDDMEGPEWNHTALSPKKRELAETLLRRLAARFASGGFLHSGQGKWYPGEPLPRWALGVWWRADGKPLWREPTLIADTRAPGSADVAAGQRFATGLAERLGLDPAYVITAYEDVPKLLAAEAALPPNADPLAADLTRPDERARLARLLLQGLDRPAGFVLPLRANPDRGRRRAAVAQQPVAGEARTALRAARRFAARPAASAGVAAGRSARGRRSRSRRSIRSRLATSCPQRQGP